MLGLMLAILFGVFCGTITGLIPGIHINLLTATLISLNIENIEPNIQIIYVVSLSITHTFVDFIPSVFLGAATEETINSVLPGHKYLLSGDGYKAVYLTLIGSSIGILSLVFVIPFIYFISQKLYFLIERMMGFILIIITIMLLKEDKKRIYSSIMVFFLAGVIGAIALNANIRQPLLPLFTGLFGASTLIYSINKETIIPPQEINKPKIGIKELVNPAIKTLFVSPISSFLPGLGSSQAATFSSRMSKELKIKEYLILVGSINTLVIATSITTFYLLGKTRTGTASAIAELTQQTAINILEVAITIIIASIIAFFITKELSKIAARKINNVNYKMVSYMTLVLITLVVIRISSIEGFLIYVTSTSLGLYAIKENITRSHLMGSILLPTILYYLPIYSS